MRGLIKRFTSGLSHSAMLSNPIIEILIGTGIILVHAGIGCGNHAFNNYLFDIDTSRLTYSYVKTVINKASLERKSIFLLN